MEAPQPEYRKELHQLYHQRINYLLLLTAGFFLVYFPLDYFFVPSSFLDLFQYRTVALLVCLFLFFLNYQDDQLRYTVVLSFTIYGVFLFVISLMVIHTGGISSLYFAGYISALVFFTALIPLSAHLALISGFLNISSYLLALYLTTATITGKQDILINNLFFMVCFVLLVSIQSRFETLSRKESFTLHLEEEGAANYLEQQAEALEAEIARRSREHRQTENRYHRLFDHIIDDVILVEKNGRLLYANSSFYEHLGLIQGNSINLVELAEPNERDQLRNNLLDPVARGDVITNYQTRLIGTSGEHMDVEINGNKLERAGRLIGLQLIIRDISVRKRMEEEVRKGLFVRKQTENAAIMALARLSEYRDVTPKNHLKRIREYSRLLTQFLARKPEYQQRLGGSGVSDLAMASVLHDIGKVGIADDILFQSGPLSAKDMALTRQHTIFGGDVIKAMEKSSEVDSGFLAYAKNIAYFHHEKWDGRGYPFGLVGREIPLEARIVALADAYESMTSSGIHGEQLSHQQAIHVLLQEAGHHFDPEIVDAFVACEQDFAAVRQSLPS